MLNRWLGILFGAAMLLVNAEIVRRDILNKYLAGNPPPNYARTLDPNEVRRTQVGIFDETGRCIGRSWTKAHRSSVGDLIQVATTTLLEPVQLAGGLATPQVRIEMTVNYRQKRPGVDDVDFQMYGLGFPVSFKGAAMGTGEFPFEWQVGDRSGQVVLDSRIPASLGSMLRPFDVLPDLYVGRKWRLDLLDAVTPLLNRFGGSLELEPVYFEVTGRETIEHGESSVDAFVVEGGDTVAWVAADGLVLRQRIRLPLFGMLELRDEKFDNSILLNVLRRSPDDSTAAPNTASQPATAPRPRRPNRRVRNPALLDTVHPRNIARLDSAVAATAPSLDLRAEAGPGLSDPAAARANPPTAPDDSRNTASPRPSRPAHDDNPENDSRGATDSTRERGERIPGDGESSTPQDQEPD